MLDGGITVQFASAIAHGRRKFFVGPEKGQVGMYVERIEFDICIRCRDGRKSEVLMYLKGLIQQSSM